MNSHTIIQSLGWTLIHSLWQSLLLFVLLKFLFRTVALHSAAKYLASLTSLALIVAASVATFIYLTSPATHITYTSGTVVAPASSSADVQVGMLGILSQWIDAHIIWITGFWILGVLFGLLRMAAGIWYIQHLKKISLPVAQELVEQMTHIASRMQIRRRLALVESAVTSPMVVGFLKPVILFPLGMLANLTPQQIESILIHEMVHINRHDFLINLIQAVVESIFFFNPFVLLISGMVRDERENICDDRVIEAGVQPIEYVRTLAQLETVTHSPLLAMTIGGNKNQLLNRIKRIMEKSARNEWSKGRMIPVLLLIAGLFCASWLSIGTAQMQPRETTAGIAADTTIDNVKSFKRKRYNQDLERRRAKEALEKSEAQMPAVPPAFADEYFSMRIDGDSLPPQAFGFLDSETRAEFNEQFNKKFKEQFGEFYEQHQDQIQKMMNEAWAQHEASQEMWNKTSQQQALLMEQMAQDMVPPSPMELEELKEMEERLSDLNMDIAPAMPNLEQLKAFEQLSADMNALDFPFDKQIMEEMSANGDEYKNEIARLMVKDGYMKAGEKINGLMIEDDGKKMTINGVRIKEEHQEKYRDLSGKYFRTWGRFGRSE